MDEAGIILAIRGGNRKNSGEIQPMRATLSVGSMILGASVIVAGQSSLDGRTEVQLERLFPSATTFSPKQSSPPHVKAFRTDSSGQQTLLGVAFWTTEIEPRARGHDGPI